MHAAVNVAVTGGPGGRLSPRAVVRGGVLTFNAVDLADEGQYSCKALNTYGEHTSQASIFVRSMLHDWECGLCGNIIPCRFKLIKSDQFKSCWVTCYENVFFYIDKYKKNIHITITFNE